MIQLRVRRFLFTGARLGVRLSRTQKDADSPLRNARHSVRVVTLGESLLRNRRVLFFCDSTSAMSAAVHCTARSADMGECLAFGVRPPAVPAVVRVGAVSVKSGGRAESSDGAPGSV